MHAKRIPCRFCETPLLHTFVDLGTSPLCQKHVEPNVSRWSHSIRFTLMSVNAAFLSNSMSSFRLA
ncbi:MAG: hypothetical protein U1E63_02145 [Burkholderiales bacterium]